MSAIELKAPSFLTTAGEALTPLELARLMVAVPTLIQQEPGKGQPVMVLPGLGAGDASTLIIRRYLAWLGYDVQGWNLGRNNGNVGDLLPLVADQLSQRHATNGAVSIIGWSLGGVLARELSRDHPEKIRQVITMGSPVVGGPKYTSFAKFYKARGVDIDVIEARISEREKRPITVPITSIYSKRDGIVGWRASIDKLNSQVDNIEVSATHLGLGISPDVLKILARKLSLN